MVLRSLRYCHDTSQWTYEVRTRSHRLREIPNRARHRQPKNLLDTSHSQLHPHMAALERAYAAPLLLFYVTHRRHSCKHSGTQGRQLREIYKGCEAGRALPYPADNDDFD